MDRDIPLATLSVGQEVHICVCMCVCESARMCLYVITIELSFSKHTISVFVHMCLWEYEELLL